MKVAIFILLIASFQLIQAESAHDGRTDLVHDYVTRAIGDKFKAVLEGLKKMMKTGNPSLGVPVLDPLDLKHQEIHLNEKQLTLNGVLNDLHVEGLSDYTVKHADFKIAKWNVSMGLLWSNIKGKTAYEANGYIADKIPVYGAGDVSFDVQDLGFSTQAKLKVNLKTKKVEVVNFSATKVSVGKIKVNITGLYNNDEFSDLVSAVISDMVPDITEDFQEEITTEINQILMKEANTILDQYTLDDILRLLG